ncbi:ATP-binding protein [Streptomyces olivochromogenes]|uniref:ATP-binding protein n=1 Tax=Streptomyces olivochromogenes TaxID=1963 RepID=UPI001F2041A2|nr:ATP-binding protein [Streptomyces olivochromogenes]MCF3135131.1 ATP-binding protein [Streptomyces olivochromogenes]
MTVPYKMEFDPATIKHLGVQMYSTLPPVISELIANAWDAGASRVEIHIPESRVTDDSVIIAQDDGDGMSDEEIRQGYLLVGRDRRKVEGRSQRVKAPFRRYMGRKGLGKFSGFGIAREIEVESSNGLSVSRFVMNYDELEDAAKDRVAQFDPMAPSGRVARGTRITLRRIEKFRKRAVSVPSLRRHIARRFAIIDDNFQVVINGSPITHQERDLKPLLARDVNSDPYIWEFDEEISPGTGWRVTGWIGALSHSSNVDDGIQRGVSVMARGKLVQEPFWFDANTGQQYALAYLIGELTADFVDEEEDTVGTARNSLVWDTESNIALMEWGRRQINRVSRDWSEKRRYDKLKQLDTEPVYQEFLKATAGSEHKRSRRVVDKLIQTAVGSNLVGRDDEAQNILKSCIDFLEFDAFWEIAEELGEAEFKDPAQLISLFREWEIVEAKEMAKVTRGRIATIEKLEKMIINNALEVPDLHNFFKEFPWALDPRWHLVADEVRYSQLLREHFPESEAPESDRRIDFLCVAEGDTLVVVEIKRPHSVARRRELEQIREYIAYLRGLFRRSTDDSYRPSHVIGYLFCGSVSDDPMVAEEMEMLRATQVYVRQYSDLLGMVKRSHGEFLARYESLKKVSRP